MSTSPTAGVAPDPGGEAPEPGTDRGIRRGLLVWGVLVGAAMIIPPVFGWKVRTALHPDLPVAPLHAEILPQAAPVPTLVAVVLGVLLVSHGPALAARLRWGPLLLTTYAVGLAGMLALALTSGVEGLDRLGHESEYMDPARSAGDVEVMLREYTSKIPLKYPDYPIHLSGHPPGTLLAYIALVRLGITSDTGAGLVTAAVGATTALAVMVTLRRLGAEEAARRAAPFLALGPSALWFAVSADGAFAAVGAWGLAALAFSATAATRRGLVGWGVLAGLLLGSGLMLSYGLPLLGTLALAVLWVARSWRPLLIAAGAALVPVLAFVPFGFVWWEAFLVLRDRYWDGIARVRPGAYWTWGNLAALGLAAGPVLGAGLAAWMAQRGGFRRGPGPGLRQRVEHSGSEVHRAVTGLVAGAASAILIADVSQMSKAEVERIWLPWMPWLLVSVALVPDRWRRPLLTAQVVLALAIELLLDTSW